MILSAASRAWLPPMQTTTVRFLVVYMTTDGLNSSHRASQGTTASLKLSWPSWLHAVDPSLPSHPLTPLDPPSRPTAALRIAEKVSNR